MNFLIRADSTKAIGIGHIMRCLAIAEVGTNRNHQFAFATRKNLPFASQQIQKKMIDTYAIDNNLSETEEVKYLKALCQERSIEFIILDGYHFTTSFQKLVKSIGVKTIVLDDFGTPSKLHADFILAPDFDNISIQQINLNPTTRFLNGSEYLLIRPNLTKSIKHLPLFHQRHEILITYGGSDPYRLTLPTLKQITKTNNSIVNVIVSSSTTDLYSIQEFAAANPSQIRLHQDCEDIETIISSAGLAISAGGNTLYELVTLQTPTLAVITTDNQLNSCKKLARLGACQLIDVRKTIKVPQKTGLDIASACLNLWHDTPNREAMASISKYRFDGLGIDRFFNQIENWAQA